MKKKLLSALLATAMTASMLAGCGSDAASGEAGQNRMQQTTRQHLQRQRTERTLQQMKEKF